MLLSLDKGERQEARELLEALSEEKSLVAVTRAQAKQQQESRHKHGSTTDTCTCTLLPCGLELTDHNTKYENNHNNPVCILGAQSQRPFPGAASEPSVSLEQGVEATDSVSGEICAKAGYWVGQLDHQLDLPRPGLLGLKRNWHQ